MLSHIVVFWLKDDLSDAQRSAFRQGLESLKAIESVRGVYIGAPAKTGDRPVIDKSYSFALTVLFDTIQDHDVLPGASASSGVSQTVRRFLVPGADL